VAVRAADFKAACASGRREARRGQRPRLLQGLQ